MSQIGTARVWCRQTPNHEDAPHDILVMGTPNANAICCAIRGPLGRISSFHLDDGRRNFLAGSLGPDFSCTLDENSRRYFRVASAEEGSRALRCGRFGASVARPPPWNDATGLKCCQTRSLTHAETDRYTPAPTSPPSTGGTFAIAAYDVQRQASSALRKSIGRHHAAVSMCVVVARRRGLRRTGRDGRFASVRTRGPDRPDHRLGQRRHRQRDSRRHGDAFEPGAAGAPDRQRVGRPRSNTSSSISRSVNIAWSTSWPDSAR